MRALPRSRAFLALMSRARLARSWACSQVIMESPSGCSRVSCVWERGWCHSCQLPNPAQVLNPAGTQWRVWLRDRSQGTQKPREGFLPSPRSHSHHVMKSTTLEVGSPFSAPVVLTSRRLRSAGCSRMERLSRYCHRGLSLGGSRRSCRLDPQGGHRFPAGERVPGQGLGF